WREHDVSAGNAHGAGSWHVKRGKSIADRPAYRIGKRRVRGPRIVAHCADDVGKHQATYKALDGCQVVMDKPLSVMKGYVLDIVGCRHRPKVLQGLESWKD